MSSYPTSVADVKRQAKSMRSSLAAEGHVVSHSHALEIVAKQHGFRDWNTLQAKLSHAPELSFSLGQSLRGTYLGHPFKGEVVSARRMGDHHYRLAIRFDTPIDVFPSPAMEVTRRQVNVVVNEVGVTAEKTSNGVPHMVIAR